MSEAQSPARGPRWPVVAGAVVIALVIVIGLCEAAGWPFLVGPLQHWLSETLERSVAFGPDEQHHDGVRIGLIGSVRLKAPAFEIGAPHWSDAPYMVRARNVQLKLGYGDIWHLYRGGALRIRQLVADRLDAHLERLADGRASWEFGPPKPADPSHPTQLPSFGELRVGSGTLVFRDAVLDANLDAQFSLTDSSGTVTQVVAAAAASDASASASAAGSNAAASSGLPSGTAQSSAPAASSADAESGRLQVHATGQYRKLPLTIELSTTGVLAMAGPDAAKYTQPVKLRATVGKASVRFDGATEDALHLGSVRGRFHVEGTSLASVGDPLGVTLPTTGPFTIGGFLAKDGELYKAVVDEAAVGASRLSGAFTFDRRSAVPLLAGRVNATKLVLADLGPAVGAQPNAAKAAAEKTATAARTKVLPDRRFDLPSLRAMDANVLFDIAYFDLGSSVLEPLKPLRTHLRLQGGVLTLSDIDARTGEGSLTGDLQLDGRKPLAVWNADLRLLSIRLERWIHQSRGADAPPFISGRMDGQVKVSGRGRSTAEILGSLDGAVRFHLRDATVSHLIIEAAGIDVAQALGVFFKGDDSLAIGCNVADWGIKNGIARPRIFVLDTRDSTIWIDGSVSLASEALDLTAIVSPKDFSPLTLRTPIHLKGTFASPSVSLDKGKAGAKLGAAALLSLLNPLAAVIPFIDPGAHADAKREAAQCAALARRGNLSKIGGDGAAAAGK